jgi:aspartate carbamoyltransferase regulatory subunit
MGQFKVTATMFVTTSTTPDIGLVKADALTALRDAALDRLGLLGPVTAVEIADEDVVVERQPDPEPVVSFTHSELQATIAACVAEALAERDAAQAGA